MLSLPQNHDSDLDIRTLIEEILQLIRDYSSIYRHTVVAEKIQKEPDSKVSDSQVRETLMEHVGMLPIIASHLYPKMPKSLGIDLGSVLIMLSIHDIGETVEGDKLDFTKTENERDAELEAAINKVNPIYKDFLIELNNIQTNDAKFANSIDKLAPHLHELTLPKDIFISLMAESNFTIVDIEKRKKHFIWDPFLEELFEGVVLGLSKK